MKTVQLREAKATLSSLVDAAESGEATIITRHGRPAAAIVPMDTAIKLLGKERPSLGEYLSRIPPGIEFDRNDAPMRDFDL
ncbi:MAG: type II toxin-antitoxin system Phd/YefM family antitoxin [Mesorhizobium sp.]